MKFWFNKFLYLIAINNNRFIQFGEQETEKGRFQEENIKTEKYSRNQWLHLNLLMWQFNWLEVAMEKN